MVVRVSDLVASRRFYEDLGLTFRLERHGSGPEHLSALLGDTVFELYPLVTGAATEGLRLGLAVADLSSVVVRVSGAVTHDTVRDGQRVVIVQDPDGHKVELSQR